MYSTSILTISSNGMHARPPTCHDPVIPGRTASRAQWRGSGESVVGYSANRGSVRRGLALSRPRVD